MLVKVRLIYLPLSIADVVQCLGETPAVDDDLSNHGDKIGSRNRRPRDHTAIWIIKWFFTFSPGQDLWEIMVRAYQLWHFRWTNLEEALQMVLGIRLLGVL